MIKISPSLLASDFSRLGHEAALMEAGGADMLHIDVMDGHFVPNLTIGPVVIRALHNCTRLPLDVHLMVDDPGRWIDAVIRSGAAVVTFHVEASAAPRTLLDRVRREGAIPALALRPATPAKSLFPFLPFLSMVLVMTVEPGFGGQELLSPTLDKVAEVRNECLRIGHDIDIEVDGGINERTVGIAAAKGANVFVAGSAVFGAPDPVAAVRRLREAAKQGSAGVRENSGENSRPPGRI